MGRNLKCLPLYGDVSTAQLFDRHNGARRIRDALARRPELDPAYIDPVLRSHLRLAEGRRGKEVRDALVRPVSPLRYLA